MVGREKTRTWLEEQQAKSLFFHAKLHEWKLLETAYEIERFEGEKVKWNLQELGISEQAWNRVIHRGIAPVRVFAHPEVLQQVPRAVSYYRMLAMVSQKSMKNVGLNTEPYEEGAQQLNQETASAIAVHLNKLVCQLILSEEKVDAREFDLWRGMAAGSQAQGAWQNEKGNAYEAILQQLITDYLGERGLIKQRGKDHIELKNGDVVQFGRDPDISLLRAQTRLSAVEVKGGIDPAGAHERLGAALKTLKDCKTQNPECVTLLLLRENTLTEGLSERLLQSQSDITRWFTLEGIIQNPEVRAEFMLLFLHEAVQERQDGKGRSADPR